MSPFDSDDTFYILASADLEVLSAGPRARLIKAQHPDLGSMAVKILPSNTMLERATAETELNLLRDCQHSSFVVKLLMWAQTPTTLSFAQELLEQGDLFEYLCSRDITSHSIKICMAQLGLALQFVHEVGGVIHGDIKPENIGITRSGNIKLLDFSCSIRAQEGGVICTAGTVHYASPEKIRRLGHGFEADWWSYGVVLFELAYNFLPFSGENSAETAHQVCTISIETLLQSQPENNTAHLLRGLLCKDFACRKCVNSGFNNIAGDSFFSNVDFEEVVDGNEVPFPPLTFASPS